MPATAARPWRLFAQAYEIARAGHRPDWAARMSCVTGPYGLFTRRRGFRQVDSDRAGERWGSQAVCVG